MTAATVTNGKLPRKQLADQLDRLDAILDTIAEGLPGAVTDACREGARQAVRDAIIEIITNPELRALLTPAAVSAPATSGTPGAPAPAVPAPAPKKPGMWATLKGKVASARRAAADAVTTAKEALTRRGMIAGDAVVALGRVTGEPLAVEQVVLVGLGVGAAVGLACLAVPQSTVAAVGGVGAACAAVGVQVGTWLGRAARRVGLTN